MPKVAQYGLPQTSIQVISQPRAGSVAPGAFGGPIADALGDAAKIAADTQKRINTTEAEDALVRFEREKNDLFFNSETGYFNSQGRDAFEGSKAANQALTDLQKRYVDSMSSEEAKQMFTKASNAHVTRGNVDIMRHANKGLQAYEVATLEAQVENTVENASLYWNDPDRLRVQAALGEQAIIDSAEMQGLTGEPLAEKLQTYRSAFYKSSISTAIANGSRAGKEALDQYGDKLEGPDLVKLNKELDTKRKTEETEFIARTSGTTAVNIVNTYDNLGDMMEEVNKIENAKLRKSVMSEVRTQYAIQKSLEKEAQGNAYADGIDFINGGGTPTQFQAQNPEAWNQMSSVQRNNLLNGKHMISDQIKLNELLTLPKSELAKVDPNDYVDDFKPSDLSKVRSAVDSANKGQSITFVQSFSSKVNSTAEDLFGKKKTWNSDAKKDRVRAFMSSVEDAVAEKETELGRKMDAREQTELLSAYTRELVLQRSINGVDWLYLDREINVGDHPAAVMREINLGADAITTSYGVNFEDIQGDVVKIVDALKERDIPITRQTILNTYQQAVE